MLSRMLGVLRFDVDTYEDVEEDRGATWQAMAVVIIASLCYGIGLMLSPSGDDETRIGAAGLLFGVVGGVGGWALWALFTWMIGSTILKTEDTVADWGQLARGTGFANTPVVFRLFIFLPIVGPLIMLLTIVWQVACMIVAVRQCLDYTSTWRAFFVVVIALIPWFIVNGIFLILLDVAASVVS